MQSDTVESRRETKREKRDKRERERDLQSRAEASSARSELSTAVAAAVDPPDCCSGQQWQRHTRDDNTTETN